MEIGTQRAAHAGAAAKVLLAYLPEAEVMEIVREKGLPRLCTNTITDVDELMKELARIRERGYADSLEETDPGAWGVSTPIRDWRGKVIAAIGLLVQPRVTARNRYKNMRHYAANAPTRYQTL